MPEKQDEKRAQPAVVKKSVAKKAHPTGAIPAEFVPNRVVGDYLHLFVGGPKGIPSGVVIHHPIGITDLDDGSWVFSSPEDVNFMVSRAKDPRASELANKRSKLLREKALAAGLIAEGKNGELQYHDGTVRSGYLKRLEAASVATHKGVADFKYNTDVALAEDSMCYAKEEVEYREFLRKTSAEVEGEYPTIFRTCKGPMADQMQEAVGWLQNLPISEVQAMIFKYGVSGPPLSEVSSLSAADPFDNPSKGFQMVFLPSRASKNVRNFLKSAVGKLAAELGTKFGLEGIRARFTWKDGGN
jgi:hypothetical protein